MSDHPNIKEGNASALSGGSLSNKTLSQTLFTPRRQKSGTNVGINAAQGRFHSSALVNVATCLVVAG